MFTREFLPLTFPRVSICHLRCLTCLVKKGTVYGESVVAELRENLRSGYIWFSI